MYYYIYLIADKKSFVIRKIYRKVKESTKKNECKKKKKKQQSKRAMGSEAVEQDTKNLVEDLTLVKLVYFLFLNFLKDFFDVDHF